ncbi:MAG: V-type ATP synthase subunit I [Eubacteriales bacterium]|nr:V-type ATP synthase subunit I [Eubacteriales bacterium]
MPIAKMDHLTVVGIRAEMNDVIHTLMEIGAVELIDQTSDLADDVDDQQTLLDNPSTETGYLSRIESAIETAKQLKPVKKKAFSGNRTVQSKDLMDIAQKEKDLLKSVTRLENNKNHLSELRVQIHRNETMIDLLKPWRSLELDLSDKGTRLVQIFLGSLESPEVVNELRKRLAQEVPESLVEVITEDEEGVRCVVATLRSRSEQVQNVLRSLDFNKLPELEATGTPQQQLDRLQQDLLDIENEIDRIDEENLQLAEHGPDFELLHDLLQIRRDRQEAIASIPFSRNTFWLTGWIPSRLVNKVRSKLTSHYMVAIENRPPLKNETYPVLLENNRFVRSFESIVTMFSAPTVQEGDPTPILAPFFFLFFGLMLSDIGYGLLLSGFCALMIWKFNKRSQMITMLFLCGLSSIFWGFMFGSFFGDMIPILSQNRIIPKAIWFNPMDDATKLMIWSMIFGVIHLFAGMAVKIHILIRSGRAIDAVLDIVPWYLIMAGGGLLLAGWGGQIGLVLVIAGAAILILFGGRGAKNPIMRLLKGIMSLYDITSYFSDILSYTRILALVLATSVIAMVVNLLGFMVGPTWIGFLVFIIVAIAGHTLNLALSSLSAYVHTCRLHYVEFFNKFYEGGGHMWEPLRMKTRYVSIRKTTMESGNQTNMSQND